MQNIHTSPLCKANGQSIGEVYKKEFNIIAIIYLQKCKYNKTMYFWVVIA